MFDIRLLSKTDFSSPITSYWNLLTNHRDCLSEGPPLLAQTIVTVITDVLVYVLPMPTLFQLQLPSSQRWGLIALFGVGGVIVVASILRSYWIHYVVYQTYDVT